MEEYTKYDLELGLKESKDNLTREKIINKKVYFFNILITFMFLYILYFIIYIIFIDSNYPNKNTSEQEIDNK